jgi:hypothetical protein
MQGGKCFHGTLIVLGTVNRTIRPNNSVPPSAQVGKRDTFLINGLSSFKEKDKKRERVATIRLTLASQPVKCVSLFLVISTSPIT